MSDENDSWLQTALGIDVPGILGSVQETATAVIEEPLAFATAPPVADEVAGQEFSGVSGFVSGVVDSVQGAVTDVAEALGGGGAPTSGTTTPPTIAVDPSGVIFKVTGFGFLPDASVSVRAAQILNGQVTDLRTPTRSDAKGNIGIDIAGPSVCAAVGAIFFSATDGRPDSNLTGVLFSNTVEMSCLPLPREPGDDEPDSPDPPSDQPAPVPEDPAPSE